MWTCELKYRKMCFVEINIDTWMLYILLVMNMISSLSKLTFSGMLSIPSLVKSTLFSDVDESCEIIL